MTTQLKWRLQKLPSVDELLKLVSDKIITQEEAKEILFNKETESERDIESYKQEVKFLKEVIGKLGDGNKIVTIVKESVPHYITQPFYQPYWSYATTTGSLYLNAGSSTTTTGLNSVNCSFTDIVS
jgi:hypothetical protein